MTTVYTKSFYYKGFYDGWDIGFSLFILNEPSLDGSNAPKGIYRFAGYHNNHFWVDYENNLFGYVQFLYLYQQKLLLPDAIASIIYSHPEIAIEIDESDRIPINSDQWYYMYQPTKNYDGVPDTLITNN